MAGHGRPLCAKKGGLAGALTSSWATKWQPPAMSESGSQHGEANKEEGAIAYRLAKRALEEGNVERASRLAEKAARLYPGQRQV